jgi:long-subunit fatty acid transport protein
MNLSTFASRSLALVACALLPATTYAGALYFPEMSSVSESAYAGAGMVARANDAGTVFSNPAGMTRFDEPEMIGWWHRGFYSCGFRYGSQQQG